MSTLPPTRALPPQRRPLSPLRFCLAIVALLLAVLIPYTSYHVFSFASSSLHSIKHPHLALHHNSTIPLDELSLVRSYFGTQEGAVREWDLVASLYFRRERWIVFPGSEQPDETEEEAMDSKWMPWERVFSEVVIEGMDGEELMGQGTGRKRAHEGTARVVLPGKILSYLRQPIRGFHSAQLVSSFYLLPSSRSGPPSLYPLNSTIPSEDAEITWDPSLYPHLPLPYPVVGINHAGQQGITNSPESSYRGRSPSEVVEPEAKDLGWQSHLGRSQASANMLVPAVLGEDEEVGGTNWGGVNPELVPGRGKAGLWERGTQMRAEVLGRSWVAMARDQAVYEVEAFRNKMEEVRQLERTCVNLRMPRSHAEPSCWRRFLDVGHFENLLAVGPVPRESTNVEADVQEDGMTGWRYAPYLTSTLGVTGPEDTTPLPERDPDAPREDEESDFAYDWHVSFSTVSPIRLAAGTTFDLSVAMASDDEVAQTYGEDWKAATKSILSQPSSSTQLPTHPLFRTLLSTLSLPLTLAVDFLTLYYWYTRRASTGIAMPSQLIDASLDVLWRVLAGLVYDSWDPIEVVKVGVLWWMQIGLLGGWGWEQLGWPKGWAMPGLLGRRKEREGSEERKSWRCDVGGLGWGMRAGLFLLTFLLSNLVTLPPLISAPTSIPSPLFTPTLFLSSPSLVDGINSLLRPQWISLYVPQLLLNHRLGTYAGGYPLAAYLYLAQEVISLGPRVAAGLGWWGKWASMEPVVWYDVVGLVVFGAVAWQAWRLPQVRQEEGEEEEKKEGLGERVEGGKWRLPSRREVWAVVRAFLR